MLKSNSLIVNVSVWLVLLVVFGTTDHAFAQDSTWSEPIRLHSTENRVGDPLLLSDAGGRVHLFWPETPVEDRTVVGATVIYYMVKDGDSWSTPVDIIVVEGSAPEGLKGFVDHYGVPHLVFGGVNDPLQYSVAAVPTALSSQYWSAPFTLARQQLGGNVVVDSQDHVHIVYGESNGQIRYLQLDGQFRVVNEAVIASLPGTQIVRHPPAFIIGQDGMLHVLIPAITPPFEEIDTYYFQSEDSGESWTGLERITLDGSDAWSIEEDNRGWLHVLYFGRVGYGGRFHRQSTDGGLTWSAADTLLAAETGGGLGGGDLAVDGMGTVHAVFNATFPKEQSDTSVGHTELKDKIWSPLTQIDIGVPGHIERMQIEVTYGNRLHAAWQSDRNSIWYVEGRSSAPEQPPIGLTVLSDNLAKFTVNTPVIEAESIATIPQDKVLPAELLQPPPESNVTVQAILLSSAITLVVVVLVVFWQRRQRG